MFRYDSPGEMLTANSDVSKQLFVRPEQRRDIVRLALESRKYVQQEVEYRRKDARFSSPICICGFCATIKMRRYR